MTTLVTPHAPGTAFLKFTQHRSQSVLTRSFATSPVKIFATSRGRNACWVYAATLGGGLLGGDHIHVTAEVGDGARALLTTQASTKVYRSERGASQTVSATIGAGALLAVLPDPVVCFANAGFMQTHRYDLRADASLVLVDWITSGRHAAGERWAFSRFESRVTISRDARLVFHDAVLLQRDLNTVAERMGRFNVLLTAVITGPQVRHDAADTCSRIAHTPVTNQADMIQSASTLADGGTLLRIAGVSVEQVGRTIRETLTFLCPLLGDDPWSRKW